jgi:hypothetical protein
MGDSFNSMSDRETNGLIEMPPRAPEVESDSTSHWMKWHAEVPTKVTALGVQQLQSFLSQGLISVRFRLADRNHIEVEVKQTPIGGYTELYDASLRALFYLEKWVGTLISIEGYPRSQWNTQFIFAKRFGAFD